MPLDEHERERYSWQMDVPDFGQAGQERLKRGAVLVSRCGGVGSVVAYELAAAGVGKLVLAHGGAVKASDLNRQLLMTHDWLGKPRMQSVLRRLREWNPLIELVGVEENIDERNVDALVEQVDLVVDCAPLFPERYAMNRACVEQGKVLVENAMYECEAQLTTIKPGVTACLRCLHPQDPPAWRRRFPVFGAVSGTIACLAAMEAIKVLGGFGEPLYGSMLCCDLRSMRFHRLPLQRDPACACCGGLTDPAALADPETVAESSGRVGQGRRS